MKQARHIPWAMAVLLAVAAEAAAGAPAPPAAEPKAPGDLTGPQRMAVSLRAAQVDALEHLAALVWASHVTEQKTVGEELAPGGEAEINLCVALRAAHIVGEPRRYSDGVTDVDLEIPMASVVQAVSEACAGGDRSKVWLEDLKGQEGLLRVTGSARAPDDFPLDVAVRLEAAPPDLLTDMFPLGWRRVSATGRVDAVRTARVRAYKAMEARIRSIPLGSAQKVDDLIRAIPAAQARLDVFIRSLPLAGRPRMMPDRIAEVEITTGMRDLIRILKEIRALDTSGGKWTDEPIDHISVLLKTDHLTVIGRGRPEGDLVRPPRPEGLAGGRPLPDWAAKSLEATGIAALSDEIEDKDKARLLAARSAKARATMALERLLNEVILEDGRTVRERASKDEVFRKDVTVFLESARTVASRAADDGRWEVVLRLPLVRLHEFSLTAPSKPAS